MYLPQYSHRNVPLLDIFPLSLSRPMTDSETRSETPAMAMQNDNISFFYPEDPTDVHVLNITEYDRYEDWERFIAWTSKTTKIVYYFPLGMIVVGLVGNTICAKVIGKIQKKVKGVRLIRYLTVVDIMFLIMFLIVKVVPNLCFIQTNFKCTDIIHCYAFLCAPLYETVYMFEIYLTVLIAVQRCLPLTMPFKFKSGIRDSVTNKLVTGILGFTLLFHIPVWIYYRPSFFWNIKYNMTMIRTGDFNGIITEEANVYWTVALMIVRHCLPMAVLVLCNVILIISRRRMIRRGHNEDRRSANQLTAIVMAITITSVITHGLFITKYTFTEFKDGIAVSFDSYMYAYFILQYAQDVALCVNSSTNFIFYCTFGREFRRTLMAMLKRGTERPRQNALELRGIPKQASSLLHIPINPK